MKETESNILLRNLDSLLNDKNRFPKNIFDNNFTLLTVSNKNRNTLNLNQFKKYFLELKKCINNYSINIDLKTKLKLNFKALENKKDLNCISRTFSQIIEIKKNKIYAIHEKKSSPKKNMSGGVGYTQFVDIPPIAGQPVIQGYLDAARPIFRGRLIENPQCNFFGGKHSKKKVVKKSQNKKKGSNKKNKKITQKGGGYYLAVGRPRLNVLPQYGAYERNQIPDFVDEVC